MAKAGQTTLRGPRFDRDTFGFLKELAANNERPWFEANRHRYESSILDPALAFIESMGPRIERISTHLVAVPKRSGGSLMRVYRDTRFSRDKTPYKTNVGIQFRHEAGKDVHAPGFYVHVEPGRCFAGAGIWHPESAPLQKIRQHVADHGPEWRRASRGKRFTEAFALSGSTLVRPPRGFDPDDPYIEDIKRKDFIAIAALADREVTASDFGDALTARLKAAKPLMAFLCAALELPF